MSIKAPLRLYERPGTRRFYWRASLPADLHKFTRVSEVRLALHEERRDEAVTIAHHLNADYPRLIEDLRRRQRMSNDPPSQDHFQHWRDALIESATLRRRIDLLEKQNAALEQEALELRTQMAGMVDRGKAHSVIKQAHTLGKVKGHESLAELLVFPWPAEKTVRFSELGTSYLASFNSRLNRSKKKPPSAKAREKYERDIELFVAVMGDVNIGAIDKELAGKYCEVLKQLPPNMNRVAKYRDKSISEVLAMKPEPQSEVTISGKMGTLSSMFKWALEEKRKWGVDANPFAGYALEDGNKTVRRPFTHDELLALLNHSTFAKRQFRTTYGYWLIPLGLFTGARLGELCQLDLKDFVEVEGVPCIDINDSDAYEDGQGEGKRKKRLKTENAKRLIPIHPELIRLGILRYVEKLKGEGHIHLFPELSRTRRDGPSHAASNWFQKFRADVGVTKKQESVYYSFRHGFITSILDQGISEHMLAPIVGHEPDLITGRVYWNVKDATKRKPTVDAFALQSDLLALIPSVEQVRLPKAKLNTNPPRKKKPGTQAG